jgi:O-methyltransferase
MWTCGEIAPDDWRRTVGEDHRGSWAYASLDEVKVKLAQTGYPGDKLVFVKGLLENTAADVPSIEKLSLLRLDTDWHASTKAALEHLYPRLTSGGILIVDDYGHYKGQQLAVDEYFAAHKEPILFNRIDYSCRLAVKR